jgi:Starch-binding associating with outer membrane
MKQLLKYITGLALLITVSGGCKKYSDFQVNPNQPSTATPALLLTNICYSIFWYDNTPAAFAGRHLTYYERGNSVVDYSWNSTNGNNDNYNIENFDVLRQVMQMDSLAVQGGQPQYLGLTKFFRALLFSQMTEVYGDIPYSQALQGNGGNFKPTYDTQENIYKGILQELEEANTLLDDSKGKINGDIIYGGTASQWKKLVNAFKLRLLIHLSKKEANTNLNIKTQFQNIISNPATHPLFTGNDDNAQLIFNSSAPDNYYPDFGYLSLATAVSMEKGFVQILKDRSDPRLFSFAEPISGLPAGVFANYAGVDAGLTVSDQQTASSGASRIKQRYYNDKVNEPWVLMGYAEQEFLIAEAISRNWITGAGTAQSHYNNAITASMNFYGISGGAVTTYLAGPNVVFSAPNALSLIAYQKYIALFMNSGWEAFMEQRRTGIPTLSVGPGTANNKLVPKRWLYPLSEYDYNAGNLATALQSQYSGDDNVNKVMWLLQ